MYLDTTYNLCKEKPNFEQDQQIKAFNSDSKNKKKKRDRQFGLTILSGLNGFRKIVVFGFAIVLNESLGTTYKILKTFFSFHSRINTETIITDGAIGIKSGISKLIEEGYFKGKHLTDAFHFMKNLQLEVSQIYKA